MQVGLCPTTFKKACRRFGLEEWPFKKGQIRVPPDESKGPADGASVSAVITTKTRKPLTAAAAIAANTRQAVHPNMQEGAHDNAAFTFSCSSPVWRDPLISSSSATASSATANARRAAPLPIPGQQMTIPLNARPNFSLAMPPGMLPPNTFAGQHTHPYAALAAQSAVHQQLFAAPPFDSAHPHMSFGTNLQSEVALGPHAAWRHSFDMYDPCILHPTPSPYTLHSTPSPHTLHSTPSPCTLHPTP